MNFIRTRSRRQLFWMLLPLVMVTLIITKGSHDYRGIHQVPVWQIVILAATQK